MPQRCTVCHSPARAEIDRALVTRAASFRDLAARYRLKKSAMHAHYCEHLPDALVQAKAAADVAAGDALLGALRTELDECLACAKKLRRACDEWLTDPDDPTRYTLEPRADDLNITYWTAGTDGRPVRKRARLSTLLARLDDLPTYLFAELVETKHADPRELILKAAQSIEGHVTLVAKLAGKLQEAAPIVNILASPAYAELQTAILDALTPFPDARVSVAQALSQMGAAGAGGSRAQGANAYPH